MNGTSSMACEPRASRWSSRPLPVFFRTLRRQPAAIGAVAPSSRWLARALTFPLRSGGSADPAVLEVGPGTGVVTAEIVRYLGRAGRLDIVELQPAFVRLLEHRFATEVLLRRHRSRVRIFQGALEELAKAALAGADDGAQRSGVSTRDPALRIEHSELSTEYSVPRAQHLAPSAQAPPLKIQRSALSTQDSVLGTRYDCIISGLPLTNFAPERVAEIFRIFRRLLKPGGVLSYFEYMHVRRVKTVLSRDAQRRRLQQLNRVIQEWLGLAAFRRDSVWINLPPAWVHHLRFRVAPSSSCRAAAPQQILTQRGRKEKGR